MNLEERVREVVKARIPHMSNEEHIQLAAFLTAECWCLINEYIHDYYRYSNRSEKRGRK